MYRTSVVVAGGRQWWFDVLERFLWLQVIYGGCLLWLQVDDGFVEDKYSETYANMSQRRPAFLDVAMLEVRTYYVHPTLEWLERSWSVSGTLQ